MIRVLSRFVCVAVFMICVAAFAVPDAALAKSTNNPNHKGWSGKHPKLKKVEWKPISAKCDKCKNMVAQYNDTVEQLLTSRYWVKFWRDVNKDREKGKADPFWPGKGDINDFEGEAIAANLELMELQSAQLELHKKLVTALEQQASYLRGVIIQCELTACGKAKKPKIKDIKIGGDTPKQPFQPNIAEILNEHAVDWKGPYSTACLTCEPIVTQLNAVPGWITRAHFKLNVSLQRLRYAEIVVQSNKVKLGNLSYAHPDKLDFEQAKQDVANHKAELKALTDLFKQLLKDLANCEAKHCPKLGLNDNTLGGDTGLIAIGLPDNCSYPAAHESIEVGPNNEVGSRANFKEKAKKKVVGAAVGAAAKLIGLGGGGGGKADGPQTYKDPIKKKRKTRVRDKKAKRDLYSGGAFTDGGLLISNQIKKAPGKGTFHTIYLENPRGWRIMPVALYMYEIWRDWKLNVSWTKDTYVDGELVKHEEGGWSESWRELIGSGEGTIYAEVMQPPLWEQLGFNTAVSGARSLGTLFPVSPQMLASEPWNLVVHVSDPKKDPVVTVPYLFELGIDKKGRVTTKAVDNTLASQAIDCDSLQNQANISSTPSQNVSPAGASPSGISTEAEGKPEFEQLLQLDHSITRQRESFDLESKQSTLAELRDARSQLIKQGVNQESEPFVQLEETITTLDRQIQNTANMIDELVQSFMVIYITQSQEHPGGIDGFRQDFDEYKQQVATENQQAEDSGLETVSISNDLGPLQGTAVLSNRDARGVLNSIRQLFELDNSTITEEDKVKILEVGSDTVVTEDPVDVTISQDLSGTDMVESTDLAAAPETDDKEDYAEILEARFARIYEQRHLDNVFIEQFDFTTKYEALSQLEQLRDRLILAGTPPDSPELTEVIDTQITLKRQLENAENRAQTSEYSTYRMAINQVFEHADYLGVPAQDIVKSFWSSYDHYKNEREAKKRDLESGGLETITLVGDIGHLRGGSELSAREAIAIADKYQSFLDSRTRFNNSVDALSHSSLNLVSATNEEISVNSKNVNSIDVLCTGLDDTASELAPWFKGVFSDGSGRGLLIDSDSKASSAPKSPNAAECAVKVQSSLGGLIVSDYFGLDSFIQPQGKDNENKLVLKQEATSSKPWQPEMIAEEPEFQDRDGDGIEDSIDTKPDEYSNSFFQKGEGHMVGNIQQRNGNSVRIRDLGADGVSVEVGSETENSSTVELLGVELELSAGTILDGAFG